MKRSLPAKVVLIWCCFYALVLGGGVARAHRQEADWRLIETMIPFCAMACGSIGLYLQKAWGNWTCASTLGLLTMLLPFGCQQVASMPGKDLNRLAVSFSVLAFVNAGAVAYLAMTDLG